MVSEHFVFDFNFIAIVTSTVILCKISDLPPVCFLSSNSFLYKIIHSEFRHIFVNKANESTVVYSINISMESSLSENNLFNWHKMKILSRQIVDKGHLRHRIYGQVKKGKDTHHTRVPRNWNSYHRNNRLYVEDDEEEDIHNKTMGKYVCDKKIRYKRRLIIPHEFDIMDKNWIYDTISFVRRSGDFSIRSGFFPLRYWIHTKVLYFFVCFVFKCKYICCAEWYKWEIRSNMHTDSQLDIIVCFSKKLGIQLHSVSVVNVHLITCCHFTMLR